MDLNRPEWFQDPYPDYARLRASGQPLWLPHEENYASEGVWLFARYAEAVALFKETRAITKNVRDRRLQTERTPFDIHMLNRDGADHARLRRLVAHFFSPHAVGRLEPAIVAQTDLLIEAMRSRNEADLIADFAEPLPLFVIARLLGLDPQEMAQVRKWSTVLAVGSDSVLMSEALREKRKQALSDFLDYVGRLEARMRTEKGERMVPFLFGAEASGRLSHEEVIATVTLMLFAGHETTVNLIGNGLWLLLSDPEQWKLLQRRPELVPGAVEEILRYECPIQRSTYRFTTEPVTISGFRIKAGHQLAAIIGSANRDEREFRNPEVFDVTRSPNRHLAFGVGVHNCLGKTLARLEGRIALRQMLSLPVRPRLLSGQPRWRKNSFFRGLEALPVTLA
jgi:cytochrome P450